MYLSDCDEFYCRPTIVFQDIFIPLDHEILLLDHQIEWSSFRIFATDNKDMC
jgi:hypothetical protein